MPRSRLGNIESRMDFSCGLSSIAAWCQEWCGAGHSVARGRGLLGVVGVALWLTLSPASLAADVAELAGQVVVDVRLYRDGRFSDASTLLELVETRVGQPLSLREVRESITHLFSLGEFADVRVSAIEDRKGIRLRYDLAPLLSGPGVEVRGALGRPAEDVQDLIIRRFGRMVATDRIPAVVRMLKEFYRESGRFATRIVPRPGEGAGRLVIDIDQGPVASIGRIGLTGDGPDSREEVLERLGVEAGARYDPVELSQRLAGYEADFRSRRYYEAQFGYQVAPGPDGLVVDLTLDIQTGSPVTIIFDQAQVPGASLAELVPVAREGSIDEDLLEDSSLRVATYLQQLGYRDAQVTHQRVDEPGQLSIVFNVERGARYQLAEVSFSGNRNLSTAVLLELVGVAPGEPLVAAKVDGGVVAVAEAYQQLGYRDVEVLPIYGEPEPLVDSDLSMPRRVRLGLEIVEGQATTVGSVAFEGVTAFDQNELAAQVVQSGMPYHGSSVSQDARAVLLRYLNEGYETATVDVVPRFNETATTVHLAFRVHEGRQVLVDHILVVGNRQISASTIRAELALGPGQPFGRDEVDATRRRLTALGLFRRIDLREFSHGDRTRRDFVIVVEESPATRVGYGAGVEATQRLRATPGGAASERLEFAPRGFFEIGRRNLWGKNRSIDLFTRVSLLRQDGADAAVRQSRFGFNEYRVLLNYREPRVFRRSGDLLISGFVEQVIRPSFDLFSRGVNGELRRAIGPTMTGRVGYTYGVNRVTNEQLQPEDRPLVDRLFPDITLSIISSGLVRDTRTDPLEPTDGSLLAMDVEAAFRGMGSAVGFAKSVFQGFLYRQLPGELVFAGGARVGLARGFTLRLPAVPTFVLTGDGFLVRQPGHEVTVIQDLPASQRFFAGGDSTVRGFALDRLGDGATIDRNGFPTGGNAMIVLNSELRVPVTGPLQVVGFFDAGNVFDRVSHVRVGSIRGAVGFGIRYRSPVGPIRVDLGFNLDRQEFSGERERLTAFHFSVGQAF